MQAKVFLGALILAGGRSSRMGADKAAADWLGQSAAARCRDLATAVGANEVLTVGPNGDIADDEAFAGPVGGVLAGVRALRSPRLLILAVDAPTIRPADLQPLLSEPAPGACYAGLHLPMVLSRSAIPPDAEPGWSLARLITGAGLVQLPALTEAQARLRGANTPDERAALLSELRRLKPADSIGIL